MKMTELKNKFKQDGEYVILVKAHKTLSTHVPARILMSKKLFRRVDIYAKEVRSKVSGDEGDLVFLSWNGEELCSSQINQAIKSMWKKAELSGNPSSTLFRKSAVSGFHKAAERTEMRSNLADLMAHNVSTAQKYYKLQDKPMVSVKASKQIRDLMRVVSKQSWTAEKGILVKTLFAKVKTKIPNHPDLKDDIPKKVLDKVRSLRGTKCLKPMDQPFSLLRKRVRHSELKDWWMGWRLKGT